VSRSVIDKLPEATRQRVVNAILAGASLRKAASMAGVSHTQVAEYKKRVISPTLQAAQKLNAIQIVANSENPSTVSPETLTKAAIAAGPLVARIMEHQKTIDSVLLDAKVNNDARGVSALIGTDLKGLELTARLTGLLDGPSSVSITNVALLLQPKDEPAAEHSAQVTVEIEADK
jgi:ribosomal protein S8E